MRVLACIFQRISAFFIIVDLSFHLYFGGDVSVQIICCGEGILPFITDNDFQRHIILQRKYGCGSVIVNNGAVCRRGIAGGVTDRVINMAVLFFAGDLCCQIAVMIIRGTTVRYGSGYGSFAIGSAVETFAGAKLNVGTYIGALEEAEENAE